MPQSKWHSIVLWLIRIGLVIAALWVYQSARDALTSPPPTGEAGGLSDQFVGILFSLQKIDLKNEVLSLPIFKSFKDFSQELAGGAPGRPNPFAPVGGQPPPPGGSAAPSIPANATTPAALGPQPAPPNPAPPAPVVTPPPILPAPPPPAGSYVITASAGAGGSITPSGNVTVPGGGNRSFTITSNSGYQLATLKIDDVAQPLVSTYNFVNLTANHSIAVGFIASNPNPQPPTSGRELTFNAYINDGYNRPGDGLACGPDLATCRRQWLMNIIPALRNFGFNKLIVMGYSSIGASQALAQSYYADIQNAGFSVVPGFYLSNIFYDVPGWDEAYGAGPCFSCHTKNPTGLVDPAFWTTLEEYVTNMANAVASREVSIDGEWVFPASQHDPFWTDGNLALVRQNLESFSANIKAKNIIVNWYHPMYNTSYPDLVRIFHGLFDNIDANPAFGSTRIGSSLTYPNPANVPPAWNVQTCSQIESLYASASVSNSGFTGGNGLSRVTHGYISQLGSIPVPPFTVGYGWTPADWRNYLITHPDCQHIWFFAGDQLLAPIGAQFGALQPLP